MFCVCYTICWSKCVEENFLSVTVVTQTTQLHVRIKEKKYINTNKKSCSVSTCTSICLVTVVSVQPTVGFICSLDALFHALSSSSRDSISQFLNVMLLIAAILSLSNCFFLMPKTFEVLSSSLNSSLTRLAAKLFLEIDSLVILNCSSEFKSEGR